MCGIVGYIGKRSAQEVLIGGLRRLEYRGYDSCGMCVLLENKRTLSVRKLPGKIKNLERSVEKKPLAGSLGIAHCLAPDTYIFLSNGSIKKISELNNREGVISVDLENLVCRNSNQIRIFQHKSPRILYQVSSSYFNFIATGEHRIFVAEPSGKIVEKRIKEIGDELIAIPRRVPVPEYGRPHKLQKVSVERHFLVSPPGRSKLKQYRKIKGYSWKEIERQTGINLLYIKRIEKGKRLSIEEKRLKQLLKCYNLEVSSKLFKSKNFITNDLTLPDFTTCDVMQILGYFIGDGHITARMFRFKESDKEICKVYQGLFKKVFNLNSNLKKKKGHYSFVLSSRFLANWFRENFPTLMLSMSEKDLPEFVGSLPNSQIAGLLKGLFDAEGTVNLAAGQIALGMTSKHIVHKIQLLLLRLGILSTFSKSARNIKGWNIFYRLSINDRKSLVNFCKKIGFSSSSKQKRLLSLNKSVKNFNYKHFYFPMRLDEFYRYLKSTNIKGWHKIGLKPRKTYLTTYRLNKILTWLSQNGKPAKYREKTEGLTSYVKKFINSDIVWVRPRIRKIPSPYKFVYDLEVEPTANFIGNGILQHNSRWATHGIPNRPNAHPHCDCTGRIALVHNGIIENYEELKEVLLKEGHKFRSQTDTEVLVHLVEKFYRGSLEEAVRAALKQVRGSYAIAVICTDEPEKLVGARLGSSLIASVNENEGFLASDIPALLDYTKEVILLDDEELVVIERGALIVKSLKKRKILNKKKVKITWDAAQAEKEGFAHFMLKEIHEQPKAIRNTLIGRISEKKEEILLPELKPLEKIFASMKKIVIISCGTAWHAGLIGEYILEEYARIPVEVDISSEFRYRNPIIDKNTLVLAITQSGETADTLAGVREAKARGAKILSICNVSGSSIPRESDAVIYTHAGPEIAVASTKAYSSQLAVLYLFTLYLAKLRNTLSCAKIKQFIGELEQIPAAMKKVLANKKVILECVRRYYRSFGFLYLGRSVNFPTALEGALKIKEISYIHAEGYGAGEMKHGPIALINPHLPVVCIAPESSVHEKMLSNIQEIKARRGIVISIATEGDKLIARHSNHVVYIPKVKELFSPLLSVVPLQLLAYYIAAKRGCDVDQPKNLAKSVTVE